MYTIYVAVCDVNGKAYVGQTKHSIDHRRKQHEAAASVVDKAQGVFVKALRKYGAESFTWFELEQVATVELANEREIYHIQSVGSLVPEGYNLDGGGRNKVVHEDTKKRISESCKGRYGPNTGRKWSEEHRRKLSEIHKGKVFSLETRKKVSEALRRRPPPSQETLEKMSENRKDKEPITLQHKETGEVRVFNSQYDASRELDLQQSSVNKLARGVYKSTGGWTLFQP